VAVAATAAAAVVRWHWSFKEEDGESRKNFLGYVTRGVWLIPPQLAIYLKCTVLAPH